MIRWRLQKKKGTADENGLNGRGLVTGYLQKRDAHRTQVSSGKFADRVRKSQSDTGAVAPLSTQRRPLGCLVLMLSNGRKATTTCWAKDVSDALIRWASKPFLTAQKRRPCTERRFEPKKTWTCSSFFGVKKARRDMLDFLGCKKRLTIHGL